MLFVKVAKGKEKYNFFKYIVDRKWLLIMNFFKLCKMIKIDSIEEVHNVLLDMAKSFHKICVEENIPYYMLGGTMLGAFRHGGFIPWDDDMDFGVPVEYYERIKYVLTERLGKRYKCTTYKNDQGNRNAFVKIADTKTHIDDPTRRLPIEKQLGINIDVFPLMRCEKDDYFVKKLHVLGRLYTIVYTESTKGGKMKTYAKKILRKICPISDEKMLDITLQTLYNAHRKDGSFIANLLGAWGPKETVPFGVMGKPILYKFEDTSFYGVALPNEYLTSLYGRNYMILPPENKRRGHAHNIFSEE